ncbi:MAG: aldo/keto reductase [Acidimicrobiia bacterium]|nr:aldo/keto reductase [Acidimicrobiia bacterium]
MDNLVDAGTRTLGQSELTVGPLAFGCWRFVHGHVRDARRALDAAIEHGMRLVDTADVYGLDWGGTGFGACEAMLGRVLSDAPELREHIVLATKGGIHPPVPYDSSPDGLRRACEASLHRLEVDTIDLYQVHRPDLFADPESVAATLLALRDEGKIQAIGISNYTPDQHDALRGFLGDALATTQPEYSAAHLAPLRDGTFDRCSRDSVTPVVWSPLAGGRLATGTGIREDLIAVLDDLAAREGAPRSAVAIAFTLAHPTRPVSIVGSQRVDHIATAAEALRVHLDRSDCYRIVTASEGRPLP